MMWQRARILVNGNPRSIRPGHPNDEGQDRIAGRELWVMPPVFRSTHYESRHELIMTNVLYADEPELRPLRMDVIELLPEFSDDDVPLISWRRFLGESQ